ncbi:MAG TPA: NIPSNAP family protein [Ramlibacter sp.]|nr:NIPSNAP family protein [Ramlibacter sp.]
MIIELRTYYCAPGRLPALQDRFRNHTLGFFRKHGIKPLGFWTTVVGPTNQKLTYLLEWTDMAERERCWNAFQADPEWIARRAESEAEKIIVERIENEFLAPTSWFPASHG